MTSMCEDYSPEEYPKEIPSAAFGPLGRPHNEELRFWRLIEERKREGDGSEHIALACGHEIVCVIPYPNTQEYAFCPQCLRKWKEAEK
jgi:hypothetical protein